MTKAILCRALSTHAWSQIGAIAILTHGERRIAFQCDRCGSLRVETWLQGGKRRSPRYKRPEGYQKLINEFDAAGARSEFLEHRKATPLRLVKRAAS